MLSAAPIHVVLLDCGYRVGTRLQHLVQSKLLAPPMLPGIVPAQESHTSKTVSGLPIVLLQIDYAAIRVCNLSYSSLNHTHMRGSPLIVSMLVCAVLADSKTDIKVNDLYHRGRQNSTGWPSKAVIEGGWAARHLDIVRWSAVRRSIGRSVTHPQRPATKQK